MKSTYRANMFLALLLMVILLGSMCFSFLYQLTAVPPHWLRAIFTYFLLFGGPCLFYMKAGGFTPSYIGWRRPQRPVLMLLLSLLMAIFLQPPLLTISHFSAKIFADPVSAAMGEITAEPLVLSAMASALLPAVFEETACRGIYLSELSTRKTWLACLLSGLAFGLIHLNLHQFLYAFVFGCCMAWIVWHTGSLWLSVLIHFLINLTQLVLAYRSISLFPESTSLIRAGALCLLPCVALLYLFKRFSPPSVYGSSSRPH